MVLRALSQALQRIEAALSAAPGLPGDDPWYVALLLSAWVGLDLLPLGVNRATQQDLQSLLPHLGQQGQDLVVAARMAAAGRSEAAQAMAQGISRLWQVPGASQIWPWVLGRLKERLPDRSVLSEAKGMDEPTPQQMTGDLEPAAEYQHLGTAEAQPEAEPPRDMAEDRDMAGDMADRDMAERIVFEPGIDEDRQPLPPVVAPRWSRGKVIVVSLLGGAVGVSVLVALYLALRAKKPMPMAMEQG